MLSDKPSEVKRRAWMKTKAGRESTYRRQRQPGPRYLVAAYNARRKDVPFTLTREFFEEQLALPCAYCKGQTGETGSGLDRIELKEGYVPGNVVPSCGVCNRIKNAMFTFDEMLRIGKIIEEVRAVRPLPSSYHVGKRDR